MAFVTLINGEWRAGETPQTTRYPMREARAKVKALPMKSGPVSLPRARTVPIPAVIPATSRDVFWKGVRATTASSGLGAALGVGAGGGAGRGAGGKISPFRVTILPRTTSSLKSIPKDLSWGAIDSSSFTILLEYSVED